MTIRTRVSLAEFLALPETLEHIELIDGEIVTLASPQIAHQRALRQIGFALTLRSQRVGGEVFYAPMDVVLPDSNIIQPDLLWLAPGSACIPFQEKYLQGAPDLIVEILSPGSVYHDRHTKYNLVQGNGVKEYWIVDTQDRLVEVYILDDAAFRRLDVFSMADSYTSALIGEVRIDSFFSAD